MGAKPFFVTGMALNPVACTINSGTLVSYELRSIDTWISEEKRLQAIGFVLISFYWNSIIKIYPFDHNDEAHDEVLRLVHEYLRELELSCVRFSLYVTMKDLSGR